MADTVVCPVCGETNPADMEFCRNCQSRLHPLTGSLRGENNPIQPGELPTKKATSELEPILPQWLRDARRQARDSDAESASQPRSEDQDAPVDSAPDLLAGLAQSKDEDEETPDWLSHITGTPTKNKKSVPEDSSQVKWVELGHRDEAPEHSSSLSLDEGNEAPKALQADQPVKDELTDWFRQATGSSDAGGFGPMGGDYGSGSGSVPAPLDSQEPEHPSVGGDNDWLHNLGAAPADFPRSNEPTPAAAEQETLDWLKRLDAAAPAATPPSDGPMPPTGQDTLDWLKNLDAASPAEAAAPSEPASSAGGDTLDWLKSLDAPSPAVAPTSSEPLPASNQDTLDWLKDLDAAPPAMEAETPSEPEIPADGESPDWLKNLGATASAEEQPSSEVAQPAIEESPDWLKRLQTDNLPSVTPPLPAQPEASESSTVPDWLRSFGEETPAPAPFEAETPEPERLVPDQPLPDWLQATTPVDAAANQPAETSETEPAAGEILPEVELPDWISSLRPASQTTPAENQSAASAFEPEPPATEIPATGAAFTEAGLAANDVDAAFASMQTPDWLSAVIPSAPSTEENVPAAQDAEPIVPAELPSWVQAMRPVESAMTASAAAGSSAVAEERGPLAGLNGVLPSVPGATVPSSKPKPHSIKLDASEQQQAHSLLLEKILAAETSPIPMRSISLLRSQRVMRWVISVVLLLVLGTAVFSGTEKAFPLPSAVPNETVGAIQAIEAVPADAPVLLVFDYQPSTVGEMEATGSSLIDHLLLLKHPRLALLSTSPTGPALAERFITTTLAERTHAYLRGQQFVDLGYLPGGLAGVYNFAQNPSGTVPSPVWQSNVLTPVTRFSDFATVIVLTDTVESGRIWIEQAAPFRGDASMVLVASAQAGPMLLPYMDSGQVNGLVSGINGAVGVEQANNGLPGFVRRYWDAYSLGLYLAALLIVLGGLLNLFLGFRDRQAQAVG